MRILVVEDEAVVAMVLADCLERGGHEVMGPAATPAEAVALCEAARPDLALLDINLRDGGDGAALARALVARWGVPVVFASGERTAALRARDVALGHIQKPYDAETVLRCLEAARAVMDGAKPGCVPPGFELFSAAE
jgi:two-component system, response regulator PdtaR